MNKTPPERHRTNAEADAFEAQVRTRQWALDRARDVHGSYHAAGAAGFSTEEYLAYGRSQRACGYHAGVWDALKMIMILAAVLAIIVAVVLTH